MGGGATQRTACSEESQQAPKAGLAEKRNQVEMSRPAPSRGSGKHPEQDYGNHGATYAWQCTCRRRLRQKGVGVGLRQDLSHQRVGFRRRRWRRP